MKKQEYIHLLRNALGEILTEELSAAPNELYLALKPKALSKLPDVCSLLTKSLRGQFVTIIANDEQSIRGLFSLYYIFSLPADDLFIILRVSVDAQHREVPSISSSIEAADWFEREMKDWFGIIAFPNIRKLAVHPDWPEEVYPMAKEFNPRQTIPRVKGTFDFRHVEGEGVFEIPVGPVHAGIIEPGHFRFSVAGEPIINLDAQLFYTHKGTEKIAEGLTPQRALWLAERISGDSTFAHALAFCHAIERICAREISARALVLRTTLLELERLYNHVSDIGSIFLDVGFSVGAAMAFQLKERFMQLNEMLTGSRLLRGMAAIGGLRRYPNKSQWNALHAELATGRVEFNSFIDLAMSASTAIDRLETTGVLSHKDAYRLGIVGIAGRASGIARDFRQDHPHCSYPHLQFKVAQHEEGDVLARMNVRIDEVRESFNILEQLHRQYDHGSIAATSEYREASGHALGYVEGWRGEIVHWIMLDEHGKIYRWKITDPSFHNWRALKVAVLNNIVPDFPVINKSFNLSYSGNDR
ncbi:MAG: NADH-quinone oxidoreductase subunit C [Ignavibacteriae bacterium]|nr:NADH-quinone oxidoreductase subunit C [Ignavibacteriota bacterium]